MIMKKNISYWLFVVTAVMLIACQNKAAEKDDEDVAQVQTQTPVTVTSVSNEPITEYVELNATSTFLEDNVVKSNINGYIKSVNIKVGQHVNVGQILFIVKTKEAESLGSTIDKLDSSFHFTGVSQIPASQTGYISALNHEIGDYVQDGEQLAVISNSNSFGFILNVPYEIHQYVSLNKNVDVVLPDSTHLAGVVALVMPDIDSVSQTQKVLVKVPPSVNLPENLIAKIRILKLQKTNTISLPKQAVLSDEAQANFWVMKMIDSSTAVKVPVVKGITTNDRIEIIRPQFSSNDKILLTGNYGLQDTAKVRVVSNE